MKVLLVDDSASMRKIITRALKNCGFSSVVQADDGCQALAYAEAERFDLMLIDFNMPRPNGLEVIRLLRLRELTAPIIFLATEVDLESRDDAMAAGANGCLCKPFADDTLRSALVDILGIDRVPFAASARVVPTFDSLKRPRLGGVRNQSRVKW